MFEMILTSGETEFGEEITQVEWKLILRTLSGALKNIQETGLVLIIY